MKIKPPLEKDIQKLILQWFLYQSRCFVWVNKTQGTFDPTIKRFRFHTNFQKGVSDLLGIWNGKFLAIEVKRPGGKLSPDQKIFLEKINQLGGIAFVAYSLEDVKFRLKENAEAT